MKETDNTNLVLPPNRRCENCAYWQEMEFIEGEGHLGTCVCNPPVLVGLDEDGLPWFKQPVTGINVTCGSWMEVIGTKQTDGRTAEGPHRWIFPAYNPSDEAKEKAKAESEPPTVCEDDF